MLVGAGAGDVDDGGDGDDDGSKTVSCEYYHHYCYPPLGPLPEAWNLDHNAISPYPATGLQGMALQLPSIPIWRRP